MPHNSTSVAIPSSPVNTLHQNYVPNLFTIRQFSQRHPIFSQSSLRGLIFNAKSRQSSAGKIPGNGLEKSLIRIGRRVLIDEATFFEWISSQQNG